MKSLILLVQNPVKQEIINIILEYEERLKKHPSQRGVQTEQLSESTFLNCSKFV